MPETRSGRPSPDLHRRKKSPAKLLIGVAAVALIAVGVGWGLTHLPGGTPGGPGGARGGGRGGRFGGRANITVGTAPVTIGAIPIQLDALGTVTPPVTANINSRIAGQLMAVYFKEGQNVKKGEKLAQIDPRPYRVAVSQAEGQLARDEAALNQARVDLKRYQTLLAQNSIAAQQVDTQDALVKQDAATVKADQAAVDNAKLNLQYTSITAPVSGRVGLRLIDVGNYINGPGQTLLVLTQVDPIDVVFTVPEDNVPQITARRRAGATLPATVLDRAGGDVLAQGTLSTLDNQIDTSTGTVKAKARFDNRSGALFPNQFVNVRMLVDVLCNAVVVPATAVRHGSQGDYVFTVGPDRIAHQVTVITGPGTGETVSITKGLKGGETVITEGGDRLRDGSAVNLPGQAPQGGSGFRRRPGGGRGGQGGGQGSSQSRGQVGQGGGQGFRGRGGRGGAVAPADTETQPAAQGEAIPVANIPPGACAGGKLQKTDLPGGRGSRGQGSQGGFAPGGFPARGFRGQNGQGPTGEGPGQNGQGVQGRRGSGGQGFGGFRRRGQGQRPGQGGDQSQGQGG